MSESLHILLNFERTINLEFVEIFNLDQYTLIEDGKFWNSFYL